MTDEKKDVLEFPLEELEVPQAIVVMMQAAINTCVKAEVHSNGYEAVTRVDLDRLQLLCEKLEARVDDEIEKAKAPAELPPDDEPDPFVDTEGDAVYKVVENGEIERVVLNGVVFGKFCNYIVASATDSEEATFCIKQFGHTHPDHEDQEGNIR